MPEFYFQPLSLTHAVTLLRSHLCFPGWGKNSEVAAHIGKCGILGFFFCFPCTPVLFDSVAIDET